MKKIMVVGVSAGAGKSTFAAKLGEKLDLPVHHLDSYYWKAGWKESESEEFRSAQEKLVSGDAWIIEGNYSSTFDIRWAKADTFIYLELPLRVCVYRVLKRWLTNIGKNRPDMADGCTEKMDLAFLKFIVTTYTERGAKMQGRLRKFQETDSSRQVIYLANKKQIAGFLKTMPKK